MGETVCRRISLAGAREERLFFAQVREDPRLELEALRPHELGRYAVVSSGGCTALSLLARGAGSVAAVDSNRAQNHLVELKAAALARLEHRLALGFLGGVHADAAERGVAYRELRPTLSEAARGYWDRNQRALAHGVLGAGVTEQFLRAVVAALRWFVHSRARMQKLLACTTLEEQNRFYDQEWDTWRWRLLFALMLNRGVFTRTYSPEFFRHVENPSFSRHFRGLVERTLRELPVGDNYFLHFLIEGRYRAELPCGLPAYLEAASGPAWSEAAGRLVLADATFTEYLRTLPDGSLDGFSLSNICEWLDAAQLEGLFAEILRTARPGAVLCFRNFVGWTDVPGRFAAAFPLEPGEDAWIRRDRSLMQRRFAHCIVRKDAA